MSNNGVLGSFFLLVSALPALGVEISGQRLFQRDCAVCHAKPVAGSRVPSVAALRKMSVAAILHTLKSGPMAAQGARLSAAEKSAVAGYLGVKAEAVPASGDSVCGAAPWKPQPTPADATSWGSGPQNRRFQEHGGLAAASVPKLKLRWAFGFEGATTIRSQPAVYGGRVFIGGPQGDVFALDARTGCQYWAAKAKSQIRSGVALAVAGGKTLALAGDAAGNLTAFDASSGAVVWSRKMDESPSAMVTSTPLVLDGKVYVGVSSREENEAETPGYACCTFRGSFAALNAADGALLWKTWTTAEPPTPRGKNKRGGNVVGPSGAGVWATPTYDALRKVLYVVTGDNYSDPTTDTSDALLAVSPADGHIVWKKQFSANDAFNVTCFRSDKSNCPDSNGPDHDFGSPAILVNLAGGKRALLLGQKSGVMHAVDPDREGAVLWEERVGKGGPLGGIQWGSASDGTKVYVALSDFTDAKSKGGLFALAVANGERVWQTLNEFCAGKSECKAAQSGAVTLIPGVVFSGSLDGHLRAYETGTGKVVWDYDATHEFQTVNGVKAAGGSFDGGGPVIAGGMVFAGSGYASFGGVAGNVLLAFSAE